MLKKTFHGMERKNQWIKKSMDKKSMEKNQRKKINGIERLPSLPGPLAPAGSELWPEKKISPPSSRGPAPQLEYKRKNPGLSAAAGRQKKPNPSGAQRRCWKTKEGPPPGARGPGGVPSGNRCVPASRVEDGGCPTSWAHRARPGQTWREKSPRSASRAPRAHGRGLRLASR